MSPQFPKRSRQHIDAGGIDRACTRMRRLIDAIEIDAPSIRFDPRTSEDSRNVGRWIDELRHEAMHLSRRYCEREAYRQADGTIAEIK